MMENIFDLRDFEFRRFFLTNLSYWYNVRNNNFLFNMKNNREMEITDSDLIRLYLEVCSVTMDSVYFTAILFNYKMLKASKDRIDKFYEICKEMYGLNPDQLKYNNRTDYLSLSAVVPPNVDVCEMMDIFLDQI